MINLAVRSGKKEMLDRDDIPFDDIRQNMKELNNINSMLGGHAITIKGIRKLYVPADGHLHICETGCGGGDNLSVIAKWCSKKNIKVHFTGIDIKEECIIFAKEQYPGLAADWIAKDFRDVRFSENPSIIFSSLFCHHFTNEQLVKMLQWMDSNSRLGFFISDLHRHPLAYLSIRLLTRLFSRSYLVKNDAPLSVARGFKKKEWTALLQKAGISNYSIQWKWAFRYLVVCKKQ